MSFLRVVCGLAGPHSACLLRLAADAGCLFMRVLLYPLFQQWSHLTVWQQWQQPVLLMAAAAAADKQQRYVSWAASAVEAGQLASALTRELLGLDLPIQW